MIMKNALVLIAHPNLETSFANRSILNALGQYLDDHQFRDLTLLYPNFKIDIEAEQAALLAADNIVFQFPTYWYSVPPILKQWIDLVLTYGFAYGEGGDKLKGKTWIVSTTTGTPEAAYQPEGANHFTLDTFFSPLEQTARLCQMPYPTPIRSHGVMAQSDSDREIIKQRALAHADEVLELLQEPS